MGLVEYRYRYRYSVMGCDLDKVYSMPTSWLAGQLESVRVWPS